MIDPADVHAKLGQACETLGAAIADGPGASGQWVVRLPSDAAHAVGVRCVPGKDRLVCALAAPLPDAGAPLPDGPSLADLAVQAVRAVDVLLAAEPAAPPRELTATVTIHADGLTVQELTRALAALDRVPGAIAAATAAYQGLCAQQEQLSRLLADLDETQPDLAALEAQLAQIGSQLGARRPVASGAAPAPAVQAATVVAPTCANPQCRRELPADSAFCPACGTPVPKDEPAVVEPEGSVCPQCSKPLRAGAQFCTVCGAKVG